MYPQYLYKNKSNTFWGPQPAHRAWRAAEGCHDLDRSQIQKEEDCKKMVREILLLRELGKCPTLARLLDIIEPSDPSRYEDIYIVLEYVDADLKKVIKSHLTLTEDHIALIIYNMLVSLLFIHSAHVIHRDIKPSNILVDEDCNVKLCDFGLSRSYSGLMSEPTKYYEEIREKISKENTKREAEGHKAYTAEEEKT